MLLHWITILFFFIWNTCISLITPGDLFVEGYVIPWYSRQRTWTRGSVWGDRMKQRWRQSRWSPDLSHGQTAWSPDWPDQPDLSPAQPIWSADSSRPQLYFLTSFKQMNALNDRKREGVLESGRPKHKRYNQGKQDSDILERLLNDSKYTVQLTLVWDSNSIDHRNMAEQIWKQWRKLVKHDEIYLSTDYFGTRLIIFDNNMNTIGDHFL